MFEVGPGAAAGGFGHASGETVGHEVGQLVDGEKPWDSVDPDLVAVEARRADHPRTGTISAAAPSLLADHDRPAPSLAGYDQLLTGASA